MNVLPGTQALPSAPTYRGGLEDLPIPVGSRRAAHQAPKAGPARDRPLPSLSHVISKGELLRDRWGGRQAGSHSEGQCSQDTSGGSRGVSEFCAEMLGDSGPMSPRPYKLRMESAMMRAVRFW